MREFNFVQWRYGTEQPGWNFIYGTVKCEGGGVLM